MSGEVIHPTFTASNSEHFYLTCRAIHITKTKIDIDQLDTQST
jgi:hypothetical protein